MAAHGLTRERARELLEEARDPTLSADQSRAFCIVCAWNERERTYAALTKHTATQVLRHAKRKTPDGVLTEAQVECLHTQYYQEVARKHAGFFCLGVQAWQDINRDIDALKEEDSWSNLTEDQQRSLYAMLPPIKAQTEADSKIHPLRHPLYSEAVKDFIAHQERSLEQKMGTKKWQDEGRVASKERTSGKYDDMIKAEREEYWGRDGGQ